MVLPSTWLRATFVQTRRGWHVQLDSELFGCFGNINEARIWLNAQILDVLPEYAP